MVEWSDDVVRERMSEYTWYHTVELRPGVISEGAYDHRPLLSKYGFPNDLTGKTVLDVGPAHGFFAFEFERRGACRVVTLELPAWSDHDGSNQLHASFTEQGTDAASEPYLHGALQFAIQARNSAVEQRFGNVYALSTETVGMFDVVFCGSLLIHLTDPLRALYAIRGVTIDQAIVATVITRERRPRRARATFLGTRDGQSFWAPNPRCLIEWMNAAGFERVEWVSSFSLRSRDGLFDSRHGVVRGYTSSAPIS